MLAVGRRRPRQGVEDVEALWPGGFTPALRVQSHLVIRLHGRNREQRDQPDDDERPLHAKPDFGLSDFELGLLFAGLGLGAFGNRSTLARLPSKNEVDERIELLRGHGHDRRSHRGLAHASLPHRQDDSSAGQSYLIHEFHQRGR